MKKLISWSKKEMESFIQAQTRVITWEQPQRTLPPVRGQILCVNFPWFASEYKFLSHHPHFSHYLKPQPKNPMATLLFCGIQLHPIDTHTAEALDLSLRTPISQSETEKDPEGPSQVQKAFLCPPFLLYKKKASAIQAFLAFQRAVSNSYWLGSEEIQKWRKSSQKTFMQWWAGSWFPLWACT